MVKALPTAATALALTALFGAATSAQAAQAGDFIVRGGLTYVAPNDDTSTRTGELGPALAGTDVAVSSEAQFGANLSYMFTDNWAVELLVATPFEHDLTLDGGALGGTPLGDLKHLPPTVSLQYHFDTDSAFKPYVGLGLNYTFFFSEDPSSEAKALGITDIDLDDSFGPAAQVGFDYEIGDHWLVNADVRYIQIETTAKVKTATGTTHVDVDVDPFVYTLAVGYRF